MNRPNALLVLILLSFLSPTPAAQTCGDCNGDGVISILDALLAAQIGVALVVPTPAQEWACDVDDSGAVLVLDALLLAQEAAGLMPVLMCPPPPIEPQWVRSAGGTGYDRGYAIASAGGTTYLAGTRDFVSFSAADGWVAARSPDGTLLWETILRIPGGGELEMQAIAESGGTIYVGGTRRIFLSPAADDVDLVVLALDTAGAVLWQSQVVEPATHDTMRSLSVLADGSLLVLAERAPPAGGQPQAWILDMENTGTVRWQKELATADGCQPNGAAEVPGVGPLVAGQLNAPGTGGFDSFGWLVAMDATGGVTWQRQYQAPGVGSRFTDLLVDGAGIWLVGSMCSSCFFTDDSWRVRTDPAGTLVSSDLFGDYMDLGYDRFNSILPMAGGGFATVGSSGTIGMTGRYSTVHVFDAAGVPLWTRAFGETPRFTEAYDAALTTTGAIAFTGISNYVSSPSLSDAYFGKLLPQSTALDGCASTTILTDIARDVTAMVIVAPPAGVTETTTTATTTNPALTTVPGSPSPVDLIHCTN